MKKLTMVYLLSFITIQSVFSSSYAANEDKGKALYASKTCIACHGPEGKKPILMEYPKLNGQNITYIIQQMTDIKSGKRANGNSAAMQGVMHLVNETEIKEIATYLSKLK